MKAFRVPWFGMSLRTGQREYFYDKLDRSFPGLRQKYERRYGDQYHCACPNAHRLAQLFDKLRAQYGIATDVKPYRPRRATQLSLFQRSEGENLPGSPEPAGKVT
jgi:hypothetical protein